MCHTLESPASGFREKFRAALCCLGAQSPSTGVLPGCWQLRMEAGSSEVGNIISPIKTGGGRLDGRKEDLLSR